MHYLHQLLLVVHIAIGTIAIVAFWVPVASKKGGRLHRQAGRIYTWAMYAVAISAIAMSSIVLFDPIGVRFPDRNLDPARAANIASQSRLFAVFLFMLGLLVLSGLRHGLLALQVRKNPSAFKSLRHITLVASLSIMAVIVGFVGYQASSILLMIFGFIAGSGAFSMIRDIRKTSFTRREALYAHFNGLIGTGIGAYTAVIVFGGSRLLSQILTGQWQVIPWVTPAIVGTIIIQRMKRQNTTGAPA